MFCFVLRHLKGSKVDHSTPWGKIFTSASFLSLMLVHCAHNWGFWTLLTKMPSYMKTVLEFDIKQVGRLLRLFSILLNINVKLLFIICKSASL